MKVSSLLTASILAIATLPACANTIDRVRTSIVRIEARSPLGETAICTGFVVNPKVVLTAAHCVGTVNTADGYPADLIKIDEYYDLAALRVDTGRKPLSLSDAPPYKGEKLWGTGYGWGWSIPISVEQTVLARSVSPSPKTPVGVITQGGYAHGMSGGPITDINGEVVGMVQRSFDGYGYGVGTLIIRAFLLDAGVTLP